MATVPASAKATPAAKYDAQVSAQLAKAERRVRVLDLATGLLGFLALSLGFTLVLVLLHWKVQLSITARQVALGVYLLGAGAFLTWKVLLPLRRPINPRFAALQLERTLPGSKNSLLNFIDLRDENLPPAIRGALSRRAAKDAVKADVEQAIPGRKAGLAGGIAAGLAVLCLTLMFAVGFRDFFKLLGGVFAPLQPTTTEPVVQKNRVLVRLPEGGDATVPAGSAIAFAVQVEGDLPPGEEQTPKLILTYPQSKTPVIRQMIKPSRPRGEWTAAVSALEVRDGFTYRITAGDAESPEYCVSVFFTPVVTKFQAVYHYRPYVGQPSLKVQVDNRRLQAWRGTEVALRVQTNGAVKDAQIEMTGANGSRQSIAATVAADDREAFEARFPLKENGTYRVRFNPVRGEPYLDPLSYELLADEDKPPHKVELTKPGFDIRLPANGLLKLEGLAEDDIGVKSLTLRMQVVGGSKLKEKPYRSDKELRLPGGGYLKMLAYKDVVDLKTVQNADGKAAALKAGDVLEYWLEARDACDYPRPEPQHGESKHFRVTLTEPEQAPQKQQKERDDAGKEQKDHQAKQDDERRQEDQKRKEEQQEAESKQGAGKEGEAPKTPKEGDDPKNEENEGEGDKSKEKADQPGAAKGGKPNPAESKPDPNQGGNSGKPQPDNKGDGKPEGKEEEKKQAGQCKECKNPGGQGAAKEGGKNEPKDGPKGDGKDSSAGAEPMGSKGEKPGEAKEDTPPPSAKAADSGAGKGGDPKKDSAQAKSGGAKPQTEAQPQGKEGGAEDKVADGKPPGEAKEQPGEEGPGDATAKESGEKKGMGGEDQAKAKGADNDGPRGQGEKKPSPDQKSGPQAASAKGNGEKKSDDTGGDVSKIDAKNPSVKDLQNLLKALENGDKEQVDKALQKLEEVGHKAQNPDTRKFAEKLTDDLKKFVEGKQQQEKESAGNEKPSGPDTPPGERNAETKGDPGKNPNESAGAKEGKGDPTAKKGNEKGPGRNEPMTPPDGVPEKPDPTQAQVKGPLNPLGRNDDTMAAQTPESPVKPVDPLKQPNSTLQLEKFDRKKYQDLEDKLLAQKKPSPRDPKVPSTGSPEKLDPSKGSTLPAVGGRSTDASSSSTDSVETGRALPPPGYRKSVPEFTKIRAEPK